MTKLTSIEMMPMKKFSKSPSVPSRGPRALLETLYVSNKEGVNVKKREERVEEEQEEEVKGEEEDEGRNKKRGKEREAREAQEEVRRAD
jgi:hypothetical protein